MAHTPRLYVPGCNGPGPLHLDESQAKRLATVLRLRAGDSFLVFSGEGHEWRAEVTAVQRRGVLASVHELARSAPPAPLVLDLWCAVVRPARSDWMVEKCTEAGADLIRPLVAEHSARGDRPDGRQERWERIAIEATEQCGRLFVPVIQAPARFAELIPRLIGPFVVCDPSGEPWERIAPLLPLAGPLARPLARPLAIAIGPEGGWSEAELAAARAHGGLIARLGPHILRTETAAVVATALVRATAAAS